MLQSLITKVAFPKDDKSSVVTSTLDSLDAYIRWKTLYNLKTWDKLRVQTLPVPNVWLHNKKQMM